MRKKGQTNKGSFIKGQKPWNKGKLGWNKGHFVTKETGRKISDALIKNHPTRGKKLSVEIRRKMSQSHPKGDKHPMWKGGITTTNRIIRNSLEYKLWRESVFARDNWTCVWCGARNGRGETIILHADHIKQFAYYPELRFAIDNGRTLCKPCHKTTDTFSNKKTC